MPRGSWYSQLLPFGWFDPQDRPSSAAYQVGGRPIPDSQQGIALPTRGGLGKWYNVTPPGSDRPFPMQQTDIGPDPRTGRGVDISAAGAHQMGYSPKNFPTDANFKVEPIDTTGLGLAAGYMGGVPGQNDTAVAQGPPQQGRKMPNSLMDMFQSRDPAGEPSSFADNLQARSNSLIGLGLGLLQPSNPLRGQSSWGNALEGFQAGAQLDTRQATSKAALAHQKTQDARQAAMDQFQRAEAVRNQANLDRTYNTPQVLGSPESGYYLYDRSRTGPQVAAPGAGAPGTVPGTPTAAQDTGGPIRQILPGQGKAPPAGYEWGPIQDGRRTMVPIEGGPATKLSDTAAGHLALLQAAKPGLEEAKKYFLDPKPLLLREGGDQAGGSLYSAGKQAIGEYTGSFEIGRQRRNVRLGIEAALRAATGAAAPETEVQRYTDMYAPSIKDSYETRKQKIEALDRFITTYEGVATRGHGMPKQQTPAASAPNPSADRQTIGGKNYRKIDGNWYED